LYDAFVSEPNRPAAEQAKYGSSKQTAPARSTVPIGRRFNGPVPRQLFLPVDFRAEPIFTGPIIDVVITLFNQPKSFNNFLTSMALGNTLPTPPH
jgi:hypothetical protein